jgi:hypothetical protein
MRLTKLRQLGQIGGTACEGGTATGAHWLAAMAQHMDSKRGRLIHQKMQWFAMG